VIRCALGTSDFYVTYEQSRSLKLFGEKIVAETNNTPLSHSLKIGGIKYKVRIVERDEIITNRMLFSMKEIPDEMMEDYIQSDEWKRLGFNKTKSVGDKVSEHPRIYIEILSVFYNP